jgi:hypothetical protein
MVTGKNLAAIGQYRFISRLPATCAEYEKANGEAVNSEN